MWNHEVGPNPTQRQLTAHTQVNTELKNTKRTQAMNNSSIPLVNDPFARTEENSKVMTPKDVEKFASDVSVAVAEATYKLVYATIIYGTGGKSRAYMGQEILRTLSGDAQAAASVRGTISRLPESLKNNMQAYFGRVIPDHRRECGAIVHRLPSPIAGRPVRPVGTEEPQPPVEPSSLTPVPQQEQVEEPALTEGN